MRDVDDGRVAGRRFPHGGEDALDHVGAEGGGWLVKDEDPRIQRQSLRELDERPVGDADLLLAQTL